MRFTQQPTRPSLETVFTPVSDAAVRDATAAPDAAAGHEERRGFTDRAGRYWRVEERVALPTIWARGSRYLLFECATIARRVWTVPANWRVMNVTELEALSEQR